MSETKRPPTPEGLPVLGHGLAFSRDPFGSLVEWADAGDVVRLSFPGQSLYMVTDPALVEQVLVEENDRFSIGREQRKTFSGVEDDAMTATTGERWERLRNAIRPAFTWDAIEAYGPQMAAQTAAHVDRWSDGDRFDLFEEMRLLTLHILGETLLGVSVDGDEPVVSDAADALVARADPRRLGQILPEWVPTPTERRVETAVERLDRYVEDVVADADAGAGDAVSVMLAAHERGTLSMDEVYDNLTGLLLAGHDTTAVALTYVWYELSDRPALRATLVDEYEAVVGDGLPETADFDELERTAAVVRETLRLYPPTWAVNREAVTSTTLGGYEIPAGAQLLLPQWVLHRDGRFWENPDTFDPSRWTRASERPTYAYFPFSGGPRHCIGMRFARLELVLAVATMVSRVALDVSVDGELAFAPSLSLRPETPLYATVESV